MIGGRAPGLSNLQLRIVSAIILSIAAVALTWLGGLPFALLAAVIAGTMFYEWCAMTRGARKHQLRCAIMLAAVVFAFCAGYPAATVFALLGVSVIVAVADAKVAGHSYWTVVGLAYAGLSGACLAFLRDGDHAGLLAILYLFAVVWATDILAYFTGRAIGGPKLAPAISPGKTWSGAIGGAVGGVVAGVLLGYAAGATNLVTLAGAALLLSIVSQAGDLFESWVKRRHGAKDSGWIIPGHGGVMDRVDGLVAAALALYVIGWLLGSADNPAQPLFGI